MDEARASGRRRARGRGICRSTIIVCHTATFRWPARRHAAGLRPEILPHSARRAAAAAFAKGGLRDASDFETTDDGRVEPCVPQITTIFWDVGGVILSNGWDGAARAEAIRKFELDAQDFETRHGLSDAEWESGEITIETYLERTIFYRPRAFTPDEFWNFMCAQSRDLPEGHRVADEIGRGGRYLMATLNNEAVELNLYRIRKFGLRRTFSAFFSSCFLGARKPDAEIYRRALDVTQREPAECVFIDDRLENVESARQLGMHGIQYKDGEQLRRELGEQGIAWQPAA